ncbi:MAG: hypothetical protein RLY30_1124 [Pseudomonadota bacterium]
MFGKILVVLLALGVALLLLRSALGKTKRNDPPPSPPPTGKPREERASRLYPCEYCGAMTPQDDVVWREGRPYCSRPHAER